MARKVEKLFSLFQLPGRGVCVFFHWSYLALAGQVGGCILARVIFSLSWVGRQVYTFCPWSYSVLARGLMVWLFGYSVTGSYSVLAGGQVYKCILPLVMFNLSWWVGGYAQSATGHIFPPSMILLMIHYTPLTTLNQSRAITAITALYILSILYVYSVHPQCCKLMFQLILPGFFSLQIVLAIEQGLLVLYFLGVRVA